MGGRHVPRLRTQGPWWITPMVNLVHHPVLHSGQLITMEGQHQSKVVLRGLLPLNVKDRATRSWVGESPTSHCYCLPSLWTVAEDFFSLKKQHHDVSCVSRSFLVFKKWKWQRVTLGISGNALVLAIPRATYVASSFFTWSDVTSQPASQPPPISPPTGLL